LNVPAACLNWRGLYWKNVRGDAKKARGDAAELVVDCPAIGDGALADRAECSARRVEKEGL